MAIDANGEWDGICACGKKEADGVRCRFGATHRPSLSRCLGKQQKEEFPWWRSVLNEKDPFAAEWLRKLIAANMIAPGDVDERSIEDVIPVELVKYAQCHFFAGIGVWSYAMRRAGWSDDRHGWSGSCPCQPFSQAGQGAGFADERHLWPAFFHLIEQCRPGIVFGEQVASPDGLAWLDLVQSDMEGTDYAFGALDQCAAGFCAPHIRQRLYWMAYDNESECKGTDGEPEGGSQLCEVLG